MSYSEQYKEHIEYTFAAFCKIVLRNAALSAYRDIGRRQKWETSLDYLVIYLHKNHSDNLIKGMEHYCDPNDYNKIFYYAVPVTQTISCRQDAGQRTNPRTFFLWM